VIPQSFSSGTLMVPALTTFLEKKLDFCFAREFGIERGHTQIASKILHH